MDSKVSLIGEVVAGRVDWRLRVRVTNLWNFTAKNKPLETQQIEMLMIDEQRSKILAVVPKAWVNKYGDMLGEGVAYLLEGVTVSQNDFKYRRTAHKFKLIFMGTTVISPIDAPEIPINSFDFWDFDSIMKEQRTDLNIIDVIGHVVQKDNLKEQDVNGKKTMLLDVVLEDYDRKMMKCTLWESFAQRMQKVLEAQATTVPVVVVIHQARLNKYQGSMGVATGFFGTKLYINEALREIVNYRLSMPEGDPALSQVVTQIASQSTIPLAEDLLQTRHMTIADLLDATEECDGSVLATVVELNMDQGWTYNSCNSCPKFVKLLDNKFTCGSCKVPVSTSPRYKLNLQVIDETGSATFTLFNTLVSTYVGRSAEDLIRANQNRASSEDPPVEFLSLIGKQFLFKVHVSKLNINHGWQTYTAKKFSSEGTIIEKFLGHHNLLGSIPEDEEVMFDEGDCHLDEIAPVLAICAGDVKGKAIQLIDKFNEADDSGNATHPNPAVEVEAEANADGEDEPEVDSSPENSPQSPISVMPHKANQICNPVFLTDSEVGESLNTFFQDLQKTPPNNIPVKRSVAELEGIDLNSLDFSPESPAKVPKKEKEDGPKK